MKKLRQISLLASAVLTLSTYAQHRSHSPSAAEPLARTARTTSPLSAKQLGQGALSKRTPGYIEDLREILKDPNTQVSGKLDALQSLAKILVQFQDEELSSEPAFSPQDLEKMHLEAWILFAKPFAEAAEKGEWIDPALIDKLAPPASQFREWVPWLLSKSPRLRQRILETMGRSTLSTADRKQLARIALKVFRNDPDEEVKKAALALAGRVGGANREVLATLGQALTQSQFTLTAAKALERLPKGAATLEISHVRNTLLSTADATELPILLQVMRKNDAKTEKESHGVLLKLLEDPDIRSRSEFADSRREIYLSLRQSHRLPEPLPRELIAAQQAIDQAQEKLDRHFDHAGVNEDAWLTPEQISRAIQNGAKKDVIALVQFHLSEEASYIRLAGIGIALELGIKPDALPTGLNSLLFKGIPRRQLLTYLERSSAPDSRNIALVIAAAMGASNDVDRLYDPEADPQWAKLALIRVANQGDTEMAKKLIEKGVKLTEVVESEDLSGLLRGEQRTEAFLKRVSIMKELLSRQRPPQRGRIGWGAGWGWGMQEGPPMQHHQAPKEIMQPMRMPEPIVMPQLRF